MTIVGSHALIVETEQNHAHVNVGEQRSLPLTRRVPDDETVLGFVYELYGVYGDVCSQPYLGNVDGETDPEASRELVVEPFGTTFGDYWSCSRS